MKRCYTPTPYGVEIKKRLIDMGMDHVELAKRIGTSPQYLTYIINGQRSGRKYRDRINKILQINDEADTA